MRDLAKQIPLRVCLLYVLAGVLWLLLSDQASTGFAQDARRLIVFETYKDLAFIGISAVLLFWYVRQQLGQQEQAHLELTAVNEALRQQRDLLDSFLNSLPGVVYIVDQQKRLLRWNRRFEEVTGRTAAELRGFDTRRLFPEADAPILQAGMVRALTEGEATVEARLLDREGRAIPYLFTGVRAMLDGAPCMAGVGVDITARKQSDALLAGQKRVLEMIASGAALPETLETLLRLIESQATDTLCSVLLLDPDGTRLRHGAAPSLPASFNQAADGLAIGPRAGSCGTAAFRRETVIVEDIATDPLWEGGRALAAAHGLRACWSTPIFDSQQRVLGTFAVYYRTPDRPNERHLQLIEIATHTAAIAISKQREVEALRESELRHRLMGEIIVSFAFAYQVDADKRVQLEWATKPIEKIIGYSEAELKSTVSFRSLIHPEDRAGQQAALDRVLAGHSEIMEFRLRTKDGQFRWLQCYNRPEWSADEQRVVRIHGASQDITTRKYAEEARKLSVSLLRATLESTADGLLVVDGTGKIVHFNQRFAELWRLPESVLAPRDDQKALAFVADQLLCPEEFSAKVAELYEAPEADSFDVVQFKDGRVFERYSRPQWLDARPVGRVWSFRDVTERKQTEDALREAGDRLHLLSQRLIEIQESERRHLARELHDEIGQALTATKINLESLLRETEPAARSKRAADSISLVERLLQTVRNLSLNLRPPMLDDLGLVAALRWLLDQHARTTGREVNFRHDLTDERFATMIETACFRVAQEALTNVTRHSRAHSVHVELCRQTEGLMLSVRDDGKGFDVAEARRRATHGNSLGLVGMEERVTLVNGRFSVTSSSGGTELRAWFPLNAPGTSRNDEEIA
jgi:PAS domain S-box-containing protein